ncbi:MAG: ABC transporter permease [Rhodospirillaceae bacterium]|jgi:peptide/nickel transport system permease protein|nr:ABC transporter permease [Rhodospirillaceae bacterium]MBT6138420.1 ABC transporter permease [Rhodospirillaceae bacterium]
MTRYMLKRTIGAVIVMWAVATLVFFMLRIVPGDPIAAMLFDVGDPAAAEEIKEKLGLDKPMYVQYAKWFLLVLQGDLGNSIYGSNIQVNRLIAEAAPRTLSLATLSFIVATMIAIPAGLIAATRKNSNLDHGVTFFAFLGLSMPDFWLAILLIIVFAANLHWLPAIGYVPLSEGFWPWFSHLILPSIAVGTAFSAIVARMIRSAMLEVMKSDFMQVARSKGLRENTLIMIHAFPNALIPVVTVMGIAFALLMSGAVVVENVFSIKGLGRMLIQGILNRDYPVVQGTILIISAIFVFTNLLVDMVYTLIDPRIRYDK